MIEKVALPVALDKRMGVLAMKVTTQDNLVGAAAVGMPKIEHLRETFN